MIINVANPIYDTVFKYLMEDKRACMFLLSVLLKEKVIDVEPRKHEYTNTSRENISMFRIDFAAKILNGDGTQRLVLIELQKTWLETETLRFRQYLGTQYINPENILKDGERPDCGIPMIAVYLLGHRVGKIKEPVLYVHHKPYNYDGEMVEEGIPDPFVESLVHDSIIVQIPLLNGRLNNRVEKVLSVFDQTYKDRHNRQVLCIEEELYAGDPEMQHVLHRLLTAASDVQVRQDMNVEDEYFSAIEERDTAIMMRDKKLAEKDAQIEAKDAQIEAKDAQLEAKDAQLEERNAQLEAKDAQLEERNAQIEAKDAQLEEQQTALLTSAKAMKGAGIPTEQIAEITKLPVEIIQSL